MFYIFLIFIDFFLLYLFCLLIFDIDICVTYFCYFFFLNLCSNQIIFCYPPFVLYGCVMVFCRRINLDSTSERYLKYISKKKEVLPFKLLTLVYKEILHVFIIFWKSVVSINKLYIKKE